MAISHTVEALPERLDVADWLDEDLPGQVGAGGTDDDGPAVVRYDDPDAISDLVMTPVPGSEMDATDFGEFGDEPQCLDYVASRHAQFDDLPTRCRRIRVCILRNDLTI